MTFSYSIIIPHRDSLTLLNIALNSIPDTKDIQIIIIDNSLFEIDFNRLQERQNSSIQVLYSDIKKGAGHARNEGLKIARGKWILFLDADDFYNANAFDHFDKYINSKYDIIYFSSNSIFLNSNKRAERHLKYSALINDFLVKHKGAEDNLRYHFYSPCSKMIKLELIKKFDILFDEVPASNDLMFSIKTGHHAKYIWADHFPAYCITSSPNSLTQTITSINSRSRFDIAINHYHYMTAINRKDLRPHLMPRVLQSLQFGLREFSWYLKIIYNERINVFLGLKASIFKFFK